MGVTRLTPFIAILPGNYVHANGNARIAMIKSFDADVSNNILENNPYLSLIHI